MNTKKYKNTTSSQLVITKTLIGHADELALEHDSFHDLYVVSGRKALYELLEKIYSLSLQLDDAIDREQQVALLRAVLFDKYGIRTQENSSDTNILIRYITRADRKNAHVYSRVIAVAKLKSIAPDDFSTFLEGSGGIEKVRALSAADLDDNLPSMEDKLKAALEMWQLRTEMPHSQFQMPTEIMPDFGETRFEYFVCTKRNGIRYVVGQIPANKEFEQHALKMFANHLGKKWSYVVEHLPRLQSEAKEKFRERIKDLSPTLHASIVSRELEAQKKILNSTDSK